MPITFPWQRVPIIHRAILERVPEEKIEFQKPEAKATLEQLPDPEEEPDQKSAEQIRRVQRTRDVGSELFKDPN
jgi:hypothetical protein